MYPSLVLVQPRKTRPYITERLLMGRNESNKTNKQSNKKLNGHNSVIKGEFHPIWTLHRILPTHRILQNFVERLSITCGFYL